ncbi:uncharacterized protein LOC135943334 [Cloeon dipterum]|uniref:uncharacterized protein LOC135943334 n=1 Tax=Cloeon dipterum TaxID=197152 RepID=UPI00321F6304
MEGLKEASWRLAMSVSVMAVFAILAAVYSKNWCDAFAMPATIEWDLPGIKEQMEEKVHGQRSTTTQLINSLQWTLKDGASSNQEDTPQLKAIFLLGGPGVGKTKTMKIVSSHVQCRYKGLFSILPCNVHKKTIAPIDGHSHQVFSDNSKTTRYTGVHFNAIEVDLTDFNSSHAQGFASLEHEISKKGRNRRIVLVTGKIMSLEQLERLRTAREYDNFVGEKAKEIGLLMKEYAPRVDMEIVKFKSLRPSHAFLCLMREKGVEYAFNATRNDLPKDDYYPKGCYVG